MVQVFGYLFIIQFQSTNIFRRHSGGTIDNTLVVVFIDISALVIGVVASIQGKFVAKLEGLAVLNSYHILVLASYCNCANSDLEFMNNEVLHHTLVNVSTQLVITCTDFQTQILDINTSIIVLSAGAFGNVTVNEPQETSQGIISQALAA